ncbi:MAG TPA: hypothetical protein VMU95_09730 [Trebonia sp.]|nr:hypothetical protein [Trebonia sp.]
MLSGEGWLPRLSAASVAVAAPGSGHGYWAGAPSAVATDEGVYLACRLRRPLSMGRGYAVVLAFAADGEHFEAIATIGKESMDTESLERPKLIRLPDGRWRLYLSCATTGTKHWRVEATEAAHPAELDVTRRELVLPGDEKKGVKDPVIAWNAGRWHLWGCVHPLADPDEADQMTTEYASSTDGLAWTWQGTALSGRPGAWDARGTRVTAVRFAPSGAITAYYDGRATPAENYEERTGVAVGTDPAALQVISADAPAAESPHHGRGLRYLDIVDLPGGRARLYYELTRPDGSHALMTELREPGS